MAYKEIEHIIGKHNDIDFLEASKKLEMIKEVNRIFDLDDKITEEDLEKLKEILKSDLGQNVFIKQLNTFRAKGYYVKSEKFVISMGEILNIILELAEKDKNYNYAKNCIILSQTFCYLDLNKEKKSIFRFIKDNKWLKGSQFWRGFIDFMIKNELEKANTFKTPNLNNIIFTQLVTYINNMKEFEIDIGIISKIVDEFVEKYNYLNKESYNALLSVIYKDIKKIEVYPKECKDNSKLKKQLIIYNKYMIN